MKLALTDEKLHELLVTQVRSNFLLEDGEAALLQEGTAEALRRAEICFAASANKYYRREGEVFFNPYHSGQYCLFLYFLARAVRGQHGVIPLCDKLYLLNKMLNALDLFYEVEMPEVFFTDHPVGTVLGRARYGQGFSFAQNCTVGNNHGAYPEFGDNVRLLSHARVLGRCRIGNNVILSSGCYVKDADVPDCSLVFGESPNLICKQRDPEFFAR